MQYKHVKNNNTLHFTPLFSACSKKRKKGVTREYITTKGEKIKIHMFEELGVEEQDLFYTILSIALAESRGFCLNQERPKNKKIIDKIDKLKFCKFEKEYLQIEVSAYELLKELNKTTQGKNYKLLHESLRRLSLTAVEIETEKYVGIIHILDFCINKNTKKIKISLNPISSLSLLGLDNYIYVDRCKYTKLSRLARLIYPFLKGLPRNSISISSLSERFFLGTGNERKRRQKIIAALKEIQKKVGIKFKIVGRGKNTLIEIED